MRIQSIHITTFQESTWGRVYVQYEQNGEQFYVFKNWLKFEEKVFKGEGDLMDEPAYTWFTDANRQVFTEQDVLSGKADGLYLTPPKWKEEYGTPSKILKRLLIELKANIGEPVANRRGWFEKSQTPEIVLSDVVINANYSITLPFYDLEIQLPALVKLVYLFFLKHPEGVKVVDLADHTAELLSIYEKISVGSDKEKAAKSIEALVNPTENSLHEKISKIKKIFTDELGEKLAAYYIISGSKGEPYKIALPQQRFVFLK